MQKNRNIWIRRVVWLLTAGVMLWITANINWGKDHWNQIIRSDAEGYYAYLPAIFIYQDLNFSFFEKNEVEKYHDPFNFADYRVEYQGKKISKYYGGTAVAIAPFFLTAHTYAWISGYETDGYSKPYPIALSLAAIFYLFVGLYFLSRLLKFYTERSWTILLVLLACLFGTNLFYYAISEPGFSHVYSFAFASAFLYFMKAFFSKPGSKPLIIAGLMAGMIVLIRPVNGFIFLLLPFLAGDRKTLMTSWAYVRRSPIPLIVSIILGSSIVFLQLLYYRMAAGSCFIYSYGDEGFNFLSPQMWDFLFSFKKGYFIYTPMAMLSLFGLFILWKKSRFAFISGLAFFILLIYVLSSWWCWYYGGSFSSRVMVEYLAFFMIMLTVLLDGMKSRKWRHFIISLMILFVVLCQIQTYQYRYFQIHWSEMTMERYFDVFLRIDRL